MNIFKRLFGKKKEEPKKKAANNNTPRGVWGYGSNVPSRAVEDDFWQRQQMNNSFINYDSYPAPSNNDSFNGFGGGSGGAGSDSSWSSSNDSSSYDSGSSSYDSSSSSDSSSSTD